jgi:hypothetical protein
MNMSRLVFNPEYDDNMCLRNFDIYLQVHTVLNREHQIRHPRLIDH